MTAKDLRLVRIENPEQRQSFKNMVKFHSYAKSESVRGRQVNYLITTSEGVPVGGIGISSLMIPISKAVLDYLDSIGKHLPKKQVGVVEKRVIPSSLYNSMGNNWKFVLSPNAPKNAGSRMLNIFAKKAQKDWEDTYGVPLTRIISFVLSDHTGTVYRGAGWKYIGETSGFSFPSVDRKKVKSHNEYGNIRVPKKLIFVKEIEREGEAIVVQGEHTPLSSGEMAVTPTQSHHSYHTVVKGGKVRIVRD